ncbi:MAG: hypothetical protein QGG40_10515, partial [Myxococcota bacterium]|nr:hypothetical protein [Myxococcota bacterium]
MKLYLNLVLLLVVPLNLSCGIDPDKVAGHALLADDGDLLASEEPVSFAVVGNTRPARPLVEGSSVQAGTDAQILADIAAQAQLSGGPSFLVHLGDGVRMGLTSEWRRFQTQFSTVLQESDTESSSHLKAIPAMGNGERFLDRWYQGPGAAYPDFGADIGFNRVGSWFRFDVDVGRFRWRFVVLDSNKRALGSRWGEQLHWIPGAVQGDYDKLVLFFHDPLFDLGGDDLSMNRDGAPLELVEAVEDATRVLKLVAVFAAGSATSQVLVPDGPFGTLHVGAGASGVLADDLRRWGSAEEAGRRQDVQLEPLFDVALQGALDQWHSISPMPEPVLDEAKARGTFEGFTGVYSAKHFPVRGWWSVRLEDGRMAVSFRHLNGAGNLATIYTVSY